MGDAKPGRGGNIYTTETGKHFSAGLFISLLVKQLPAYHCLKQRKKRQDWAEKEADPTDHNNCYSTGQEIKTAAVLNNKYIHSN